jgi:hypothetical protein
MWPNIRCDGVKNFREKLNKERTELPVHELMPCLDAFKISNFYFSSHHIESLNTYMEGLAQVDPKEAPPVAHTPHHQYYPLSTPHD